jgi:endonuclease/exonuclease/phosphatase family metal-dependent hydrolase
VKNAALGLAGFMFFAITAAAALLLNDSFDYPDGALVTVSTNLWAHHSGSVTGEVAVASGRAWLSEANTEDVNALLAGQPYPASGATNVFYAGFTVKFTTLPTAGGAYFAHFKDGSTGFRARVWALTGGAATGKFRLGISSTSGSVISVTNPGDLSLNTDYAVVIRLVNSNSVSTLWINPATETDAGISTSEGVSTFAVAGYAFRENTGEGVLSLDDLKIGTTFAEVTGGPSAPKPPVIVSGPQHQTVTNGADVVFRVTATGTPPLAYQWKFTSISDVGVHGTNLSGEVNSNLTLAGVTFGQAGFYSVSVTNAAGSALSDTAALSVCCAGPPAFSYLTYNVHGNGLTNWSTNMWHVQAIGRQMQYLDPDVITFNEIPVTNNCTAQMADFVTAFRPGYYLATNSMDDGFICNVILSRYPIIASRSWLHGIELAPFGYTNGSPAPYFTRDLFEAEISVPGLPQPLHAFAVHLKSGQDADSAAKRAAEASAVSNFFATVYLPAHGQEPYVLSGDMNEDMLRPPASAPRSVQRLIGAPTGLQMTTAVNPFTDRELTWSIQDTNSGPTARYDYILPCAALGSNIVGDQVFRTDLLTPLPANLYSNDDQIASDHLPVFMVFANPFNVPFHLLSLEMTNQIVLLTWESQSNRSYAVEVSSNLITWTPLAAHLVATGARAAFSTNVPAAAGFFRVYRAP